MTQVEGITGYGLCECRCGGKTRIPLRDNPAMGQTKDVPLRFINGHNGRLSPVEFVVEDRGYETPCHIWQRTTSDSGHAQMMVKTPHGRRSVYAHKHKFEQEHGPVPDGFELHHRCEMPPCVNTTHLDVVTRREHQQAHGKLTAKSVAEIRALWAKGGNRQADIGALYGVSQAAVSKIVRNEMWVTEVDNVSPTLTLG